MSNEEIKNELIKMGWENNNIHNANVSLSSNGYYFVYWHDEGTLSIIHNLDTIMVLDITLDRIKSLIYGLTGEKI